MCGIVGLTGNHPQAVRSAAALIAYRGPDASADWTDDCVSLAHNRLSIIDVDARSNQPMWDATGQLCIVFNGEIYNHAELRREFAPAIEFRTASDTEVLLLGYKLHGATFFARTRGMFACAIYDRTKGTLSLFRDHAGIKPLYYHVADEVLAFGSEMKSVLSLMHAIGRSVERDRAALAAYLALGYVPAPATLYREVRVLPRSHYLVYDIRQRTSSLQKIDIEGSFAGDEDALSDLIEQKVISHLVADVPVGLFFSGGTDSSLIAAILNRHDRRLRAFSVRIAGRPADERYFRSIAERLKLDATICEFGPAEFKSSYRAVMDRIDIPLADSAIFPTYLVSKRASEEVKVVLAGEGGDELFFGYPRQRILSRLSNSAPFYDAQLDAAYRTMPDVSWRDKIFAAMFSRLASPASYYLFTMAPAAGLLRKEAWNAGKTAIEGASETPFYIDRELYLESLLLRKTDLATSYASIEGRVPFLDPEVIAAAENFVGEWRRTLQEKPVLKRVLGRHLPDELVWRPKSGFGLLLSLFAEGSETFQADLDAALADLGPELADLVMLPSAPALIAKRSSFALALIMLHRVLANNGGL